MLLLMNQCGITFKKLRITTYPMETILEPVLKRKSLLLQRQIVLRTIKLASWKCLCSRRGAELNKSLPN
jgi:hypothetical protein